MQLSGAAAILLAAAGMNFGWRLVRARKPVGVVGDQQP
jgi:hypothetical protein